MDVLLICQDPGEVLGRGQGKGGRGLVHGLPSLCCPLPFRSWHPQTSGSIRVTRESLAVQIPRFPHRREAESRSELGWEPQ